MPVVDAVKTLVDTFFQLYDLLVKEAKLCYRECTAPEDRVTISREEREECLEQCLKAELQGYTDRLLELFNNAKTALDRLLAEITSST